jgi:hypothetical protein
MPMSTTTATVVVGLWVERVSEVMWHEESWWRIYAAGRGCDFWRNG